VASSHGYSSDSYPITMIRRQRLLPLPGEVLVSEGDHVEADTPVAKISLKPGIPWVIPVARLIGVEPEDLPESMLVSVGDSVEVKQVIAKAKETGLYGTKEYEAPTSGVVEDISSKSGRVVIREEFGKEEPPLKFDAAFEIGCRPHELPKNMLVEVGQEVKRGSIIAKKGEESAFFTKTARAPISGVIDDVDPKTGYITIARPFKEVVVEAYIKGVVTDVIPERGVAVETPAVRITGAFGVGRETFGPLKVLVNSPNDELTPELIDESCKGHIVVGGARATNEALDHAMELGVKGVVTGSASYLHLINALGVKLGVGITGQEDIDMTVILMEGFGDLGMREQAFNALKQLEGREVSINGRTQIRAGAIRPEIVSPFPEEAGRVTEFAPEAQEDLHPGLRVRVIADPYFGDIGEITELPVAPQKIESEAAVPVAYVKLESGDLVTVPRKNVEIF